MERLTERNPSWIDDELWERACEPDCEEIDAVYRKLKEYEDSEEEGRLVKLPYNGNYTEKEDSALSKFVATMIYYESLNNRLAKVFGKSDGLLEGLVKTFEDASALNVPKDTFKSALLTNEDVDKYEEYKRLEEQGRLIKLPCKVGDVVYFAHHDRVISSEVLSEKYHAEAENHGVFIRERLTIDVEGVSAEIDFGDIGKTVFLTESEAEAKLEELRGGENGSME